MLLSVSNAYAIIVIIPAVLIPIVNIVVWIIGAISAPIIAMSAFYFKLKNKSVLKGVVIGIALLLIISLLIILIFKLVDPQRPIY